jgi:hypothetical protein
MFYAVTFTQKELVAYKACELLTDANLLRDAESLVVAVSDEEAGRLFCGSVEHICRVAASARALRTCSTALNRVLGCDVNTASEMLASAPGV